ncbi:MAG: PD40 domain-containing protein, partial [Gemmatimonadetes bacterium]|nr:PD40 domain-containing protein [Gemmatimonadota bacterium]
MKIVTDEARPVTELRKSVPPNVAAATAKALEKLPADRFESAATFRDALGETGFTHATAPPSPGIGARSTLARILPWGVAAVMAILWALSVLKPTPETTPVTTRTRLTGRDMVVIPGGGRRLAISPDGSWIVVGDMDEGKVFKLYARRSEALAFRELPGTEGATDPVFSPDGEWVAFRSAGTIKKVNLLGGPALPIADGFNPHWGVDDTIVFTTGGNLFKVSASGGEPVLILAGDSATVPQWPHLLPDGEAVVFSTATDGDPVGGRIMLLELSNGEVKPLVPSGNAPRYVPTGHILFGHGEQSLFAVPFDLASHEVTGGPVRVIPEVTVFAGGATQFAVSKTGTAVYSTAGSVG